ncbi:hypothetical protein WCQ02_35285 [Paraburkholderia tropica]|uniref:Shufflon system plasmid conjugative transfer pilus tip adhesin PilV n=2 Tax=Bacteria TaxID=2 RepID=A0ABX5MC84_9BURK|nr:hypothetical protein [Paraburkholderia tropica]PXX05652.1 hypothetical protein C7400_14025 [Paraburkholderia tropica]PZW70774.1 hypothetical protein C7399_14025 [Paraburkholderia tropica]
MGSIIELAVYLAAATILTVYQIREDIQKHRAALLASEGQNEAVIADALGSWANDNYATLLSQFTQSGNAALTAPTVADLKTAGNLKQSYRAGPFWGGSYTIQVSMVPDGCTEQDGNCHVSWVFYPSLPYTRDGKPDVSGAAQIALAANSQGAQFGFSSTRNSGTISGISGTWTATNPLSGTPAAAILATNGAGNDGNSLYIRRDGSLTWTGSQNVNGVDLHNVGSIDATGTIAAPIVSASNVDVSNAVRSPGTLYVQNAAGTDSAPIDTGAAAVHGNATVYGALEVANQATPRASCTSTTGTTRIAANADGSGLMLSCQYMTSGYEWLPIGGTTLRYGYYTVSNGSTVPAPYCASGGIPAILLDAQGLYVDPTATVNLGATGTGPWTVTITDGSGAGIQGVAIATTYCEF